MQMRVNPENIPEGIRDKKIAIIGYGLLGRPVAHCLRDSNHEVRIGLRENSGSINAVTGDGFEHGTIDEVASWADGVFLLIPDDRQGAVYATKLETSMRDGSMLVLAHGFAFLYSRITPGETIDAVVIAPHGPGNALRDLYSKGKGLAAQVAVHQDSSGMAETRALMLARSLGHDKGGIRITSVKDEVVMDLFAEQMVLCGGVVELMRAAYRTLVDAGYDSESAYESVVRELKYTVDIIHQHGPHGMLRRISKSALVGSLFHGELAVGDDVLDRMKNLLERIEKGDFKKRLDSLSTTENESNLHQMIDKIEEDFRT